MRLTTTNEKGGSKPTMATAGSKLTVVHLNETDSSQGTARTATPMHTNGTDSCGDVRLCMYEIKCVCALLCVGLAVLALCLAAALWSTNTITQRRGIWNLGFLF